jgi:N-acetylmuramoyl-L-alanine amidase
MSVAHKVKPGETLISIAAAYGLGDWRRIWTHPENEALRAKRANPQVLFEGDRVVIPDHREASRECEVDRLHRFKLKRPLAFFAVRLLDEAGLPFASSRWELTVDGKQYGGTTDAEGWVSQQVDPSARGGLLKVYRSAAEDDVCEWHVEIGGFDPVDTWSGVRGRLANLGYDPGPAAPGPTDELRRALSTFQRHIGHPSPSGELDEQTRQALIDAHNDH